ncbi:MAG TPA: 16S rRNA (guanine(527)-N(7))-methyltransferase RsmG [Gammaproteobacteria bacterium]|jgi:16S rRNA (guanine527-N7)-methyltransferase|nr:16S rRNA (guanine(527)-N(7))-methyltransferase RsmG [Gammaproteobacteria bacterium]
MSKLNRLLKSACAENNLVLDEKIQNQLVHYLELLATWNRVFNLTAITQPADMVYLHIVDSLTVQPYLQGTQLLDVGSGAGLPGIPLAIVNAMQHWTLLDKNSKKTRFLTQVIAELSLTNVAAVHARCEDYQITSPGFDSIVSRAFSSLRAFVETTAHLLQPEGIWIAMKGKYPQQELAELPKQFKVKCVEPVVVKGIAGERHMVVISR